MRVLLLLRGSPGCGKSTWIKENGLKDYALSADEIRLMCSSPQLDIYGKPFINPKNDYDVWRMLMQMLELRMKNGEFTVIDATNSKTSEINKYKVLCDKYRYRMYCVDFTKIPIEETKRRNAQRPDLKQVPESVIDNMYARFATQKIPSGVTVINPDELDKVMYQAHNLDEYTKVNVIGDIHGCHTALREYIGEIDPSEYYIFLGDYLDRGIENADTLKYLLAICNLPNVQFLEGNHEIHLWKWANDETSVSKEFEFVTRAQLVAGEINKKDVRKFYRRLSQCAFFNFSGHTYLCTHGGISAIPGNLIFMPTQQMIKGVGTYAEHGTVAQSFAERYPEIIQIHGHRNTMLHSIGEVEGCLNLEGGVETGGCLRVVELLKDGTINKVEIQNHVYKVREEKPVQEKASGSTDIGDVIMELRKSPYVNEKTFGSISSFNFTKSAFYERFWDTSTTKARGLYIDVPQHIVIARSYEKFFNIGERKDNDVDHLKGKFKFPVRAFVKENGFLGILSYNPNTDDFFIASKSSPESPYASWFRQILMNRIQGNEDILKAYLKKNNVSMVFECVDIANDPHIIEYNRSKIVLLDIIYNDIKFRHMSYGDTVHVADIFHFECKRLAFELKSWDEFMSWHAEVTQPGYKYNRNYIEGFVIEDANGYMVKLKTEYYNFWKFMRSIADEILTKGYTTRTSHLSTPEANYFVDWVTAKKLPPVYKAPRDIISLRKEFRKENSGK